MYRNFLKKNWNIVLTELLILLAFIMFYGRFGDVTVDSFREAYIPEQMLSGHPLYSQIFCIYAPLAYIINSALFFIFGINLNMLFFAGLVSSMILFFFASKIANCFFDKKITFSILLLMFSGLTLSPNVFNSFFPYSYGILYGLTFSVISVYSAIKGKYPLAYLFAGCAACSKYEFVLLLPAIIYYTEFGKRYLNAVCYLIPVITAGGFLYLTNTELSAIFVTFDICRAIASSPILNHFYSVSGLVFKPQLIFVYIKNFLVFISPCVLFFIHNRLLINIKFKNIVICILTLLFAYILSIISSYQAVISYFFPLIFIMLIIKFKTLTKEEKFIIISSLLVSLKVFFTLAIQSYGAYFIFFAVTSIIILTPEKFRKNLALLLIFWSIIISCAHINTLLSKNHTLSTFRGTIKVSQNYKALEQVLSFMSSLPENTKVVILPESLCPNFMTAKPSDNKFYSLIPLYTDVFGEDIIIKRYSLHPPDYFIISDYDTSLYYFKTFGADYAFNIMNYISENYDYIKTFDGKIRFNVYKLKKNNKIAKSTN